MFVKSKRELSTTAIVVGAAQVSLKPKAWMFDSASHTAACMRTQAEPGLMDGIVALATTATW